MFIIRVWLVRTTKLIGWWNDANSTLLSCFFATKSKVTEVSATDEEKC